jgi:hypothetical protein
MATRGPRGAEFKRGDGLQQAKPWRLFVEKIRSEEKRGKGTPWAEQGWAACPFHVSSSHICFFISDERRGFGPLCHGPISRISKYIVSESDVLVGTL